MSIPQLVKHIHQLTYTEMLAVAAEVSTALMMYERKLTPGKEVQGPVYQHVAQALLDLKSPTDVLAQEEKLLRQIFSRRRSILVLLNGTGWSTDISTLPGATASGVNLREALNRTLDQVVTIQALQK